LRLFGQVCPVNKLGKYEVLGELGHGAMGVVYRARDPFINRLVALKTITTGVADDPALLERFYREAQSAGGLQHPNIITIYDMGDAGHIPYIAMELVEGENLEQVIARRAALSISLKLGWAMQACRAFDYAHKRGIVHRDIKPGNVMVGKDGSVKVVDFGIARVLETSKTQTGMLIGTFAYMSPEQYHGEHADERSDIWSFGVLLYELLAYQRPFTGATPASLMHSICQQEPTTLASILPDCPDELELIMSRILQKSPSERYQSMEDLLLELEPVGKRLQSQAVAGFVESASELAEKGAFSESRDLLRQALQIESGNHKARTLLEKVNTELKRISVRPKAQECVEKGRALLDEGRVQEAKIAAESALHLDSTFEPAQQLQRVVQLEIDRARRVAEWMEAAKQHLAEGLPDEAEALVAKALEAEPSNKQALALRQQVIEEKAERQKRQQLLDSLQNARGLWTHQKYTECIQLLVDLEKTFPGEEEVSRLLETVREDYVEQQKQQTLLESRKLLAARRHEECLALLLNLQKQLPRDEEIPRLLDQVRKDQRNQQRLQALADARSALAAGQYEACISSLTALRNEFPDEQAIPELLDAAKRNSEEQRRQQGVAEARKLLTARRYEECTSLLVTLKKTFPNDQEIVKLLDVVHSDQAEERKQETLGRARRLLESRNYENLSELLATLQKEFPDDGEIRRLQLSAQNEQAEQRKQESLTRARKLLESRNYEKLYELLFSLQKEFPDEGEIRRLQRSAELEQVEHRKQEGLARARKLLESRNYEKLYELLFSLQKEFPDEGEIHRFRKSAQAEQAAERKRDSLAQARKLLAAQRHDESIDVLSKLQAEFPGEPEINKLLDTARADSAERQKQQGLAEVRALLAAQSFEEALAVLNGLSENHPNDAAVLKLRALVQREQEKHAKAERVQRELDLLKRLMGEKKYPEVLSRARQLLVEFPGETNFTRLAEFASNQQAHIEKEQLFRKTLEDAKALFASGRFEEAIGVAQTGLANFPANTELLNLYQQSEVQQRKLQVRQQIEQRVREIRVKINREKFSEAIDLAQQTLVNLGPDTDLSQLLNSAQVEFEAREKKRKQERSLETIRTFIETKDFAAAGRTIEDAFDEKILDTFDPRVQRLTEQIKDAKTSAEHPASPAPTSIPPSVSREYALFQKAPAPIVPAMPEKASAPEVSAPQASLPQASVSQPSVSQPTLASSPTAPIIKPPAATFSAPAVKEQPPELVVTEKRRQSDVPVDTPAVPVQISTPRVSAQQSLRAESKSLAGPAHHPAPTATWRKPVLVAASALALAVVIWVGVVSIRTKQSPQTSPATATKAEPAAPRVDPLEAQQRDTIVEADKLVAANDLDGALRKLKQAGEQNGPLTAEIQKKQSAIQESLKDASLRQLRQREEVLWQAAMKQLADGRSAQAEKELRGVLSLPVGGTRRDEAQNYLDKVIPQRIQQTHSIASARQSLEQGDFTAARRSVKQLKQDSDEAKSLVAEIDQAEKAQLAKLVTQFNQLKQRDDETSVAQLKALLPKFQALASDSGAQAAEASTYANNASTAIGEAQARAARKSADTAFQQLVQRYQQAANAGDQDGLSTARNDFQSVVQSGGPHADEAQQYLGAINAKLASFNQPPPVVAKPTVKPIVPSPATADNEAAIRAVIQRYAQAFDHRDAGALRQVWPSMGSRYTRYKTTFEAASSIQMKIEIERIELSGDGTTAMATGKFWQDFTPKRGKPMSVKNSTSFRLANINGSWLITDVQ
jgi:eukaryotic-like serine/threonine-protein kinase